MNTTLIALIAFTAGIGLMPITNRLRDAIRRRRAAKPYTMVDVALIAGRLVRDEVDFGNPTSVGIAYKIPTYAAIFERTSHLDTLCRVLSIRGKWAVYVDAYASVQIRRPALALGMAYVLLDREARNGCRPHIITSIEPTSRRSNPDRWHAQQLAHFILNGTLSGEETAVA